VGYQIVPAAANNAGGYLYQVTTAGTSGATEPATFNQTVGGTQTDGSVVWTNENSILGKTGATEPATWPSSASPVTLVPGNASTFTTDGGIMWIDEGPVGKSGTAEPSWAQTGQITNDGGVTWAFEGNSPLTPIACTSTWEGVQTYSTSLSTTHGALEMVETDNSAGGAKIFMTGEALKR